LNTKLQQIFDSLETQRNQLFTSLNNLTAQKLNQQPQNGWSINQVIAHLITAERLSILYLHKKIQAINEVENSGLIEELKMIVLIISQRLPFKFKAPKVVVENTKPYTSLQELEQEWTTVRNELKIVLEKFNDDQIKRKIYKHVVAGKLNIQQTLLFFREHVIHHQQQIKRLL
jgi:uncharacterized damage-inducible protein DinB